MAKRSAIAGLNATDRKLDKQIADQLKKSEAKKVLDKKKADIAAKKKKLEGLKKKK